MQLRPRILGSVLVALVALSACAPAVKDLKAALTAEDSGTVWFSPDGKLVLSGDLRFPKGAGPLPAVVLMHGCGGVGNAETGWAPVLREAGYATFVVDSLGGRGLTEVCTDARALSATQRIADAYGALRILATHPRVDPRRLALMGFSHGGIVALRAATVWAAETYAPRGGPRFRAFLPFYPYCNTVFPEMSRVSGPVRIHAGELDDWTPARPCVDLARSLKAAGQDVEITVYPGAHHSFDNIGRPVMYLARVDNGAACTPRLARLTGPLLNEAELASCLRKGATIGWNPAATEAARRNVGAQLAELLR